MKACCLRARRSPAVLRRSGRSRSKCCPATRWPRTGSGKRSQRWTVSCPEQEVTEDAGGGAPHHVAVDLVDVGLEGHAAPDQALERVAFDQVVQRELEHLGDL